MSVAEALPNYRRAGHACRATCKLTAASCSNWATASCIDLMSRLQRRPCPPDNRLYVLG